MAKPIKPVTTEQDLEYMRKHEEKIVQKVGRPTYNRLVKKLEDYIRNRKRPGQVADSGV